MRENVLPPLSFFDAVPFLRVTSNEREQMYLFAFLGHFHTCLLDNGVNGSRTCQIQDKVTNGKKTLQFLRFRTLFAG